MSNIFSAHRSIRGGREQYLQTYQALLDLSVLLRSIFYEKFIFNMNQVIGGMEKMGILLTITFFVILVLGVRSQKQMDRYDQIEDRFKELETRTQ